MKTIGTGAVLPPGSTPAIATLPEGGYKVVISGFDESGMIRCVYPGEFVKHHQAETVEELAGKVVNQLRARYGVQEIPFASVPKEIAAGESFTVEA
ncbi:MAG: hypothetical protein K8U57_30420 [Planctomycetes bacterium]|nr:hypothetical protein [Planctomycetota bacterium]